MNKISRCLFMYVVTQANLTQGQGKRGAQEKSKGSVQEATKLRDAKLDALADWLADFSAIARVALDKNSQHLGKLGLGAAS